MTAQDILPPSANAVPCITTEMLVDDQRMPFKCGGPNEQTSDRTPAISNDVRLKIDGVDLKKLDKLLEVVINRLGGGGFGDWFVQGDRVSSDKRHLDLRKITALRETLEELNASLERHGRAPKLLDQEIKKAAKSSTTMNNNARANMHSVLEKVTDDRLRDVKIEIDRLKDAWKQSDDQNEALKGESQSLKARLKKLETAMEIKMSKTRSEIDEVKGIQAGHDATIRGLQLAVKDPYTRLEQVDQKIDRLAIYIKEAMEKLCSALKGVHQEVVRANRWISCVQENSIGWHNFAMTNINLIRGCLWHQPLAPPTYT